MTSELHPELELTKKEKLKTFIGADIILSAPDDKPFELLPRRDREITVPIPDGYFDTYEGGLSPHPFARFSTRSVLQQAGACVLTADISMDSKRVTFLIRNANPRTVLHFPASIPFGRFYIRGGMITGQELEKLLPSIFPESTIPTGVSVDSDGLSIILPIIQFARVTKQKIDVSNLKNIRDKLDQLLGLQWQRTLKAKFDELIIGETPKIMIPNGVNGEVLVGMNDDGTTHAQSPFIDTGFGIGSDGLPIRTEFWHLSERPIPTSLVHLQFFNA